MIEKRLRLFRDIAIALIGLSFVLSIVGLIAPWWNLSVTGNVQAGSFSQPVDQGMSLGPFDDGGSENHESKVLVSGVLVLSALLVVAASFVTLLVSRMGVSPTPSLVSPWLALLGVALVATALLLAVFTWPDDGMDFWDRLANQGVTIQTAAGIGWYASGAAGLLALVGGVLAFARPIPSAMTTRSPTAG